MIDRYDVVIVGAGPQRLWAAIVLRQHRFAGSIALIGDESELPYQRPPPFKCISPARSRSAASSFVPDLSGASEQSHMLTGDVDCC